MLPLRAARRPTPIHAHFDGWLSWPHLRTLIMATAAAVALWRFLKRQDRLPQAPAGERADVARQRSAYFDALAKKRTACQQAQRRRLASPPRAAASDEPAGNWHSPPRYMPPPLEAEQTLGVRETIRVRDGRFEWRPASALLDTGNSHCTVVTPAFAARHALFDPSAGGTLARPLSWTTLRGVVPGASARVPVIVMTVSVRGSEQTVEAAVSELGGGEDVLLGLDVLRPLFAAGYTIAAA